MSRRSAKAARTVRAAVAAWSGEDEFFARIADAGMTVERRPSVRNPSEWTGYKVAHSSHTTAGGQPLWFSGGSLAADLTLPKLRQRWVTPPGTSPARTRRCGSPSRRGPKR